MNKEFKSFPVEIIKADSDSGIVEAVVSVMGNVDHGEDIIHNGAFTKTITERGTKIKVLDNHNANSNRDVIGKTLSIRELSKQELPPSIAMRYPDATGGLYTVSQFDMEDDNAKAIFGKLKNGFIDEWSIGFTIPKGKSDIEEKFVDGVKRLIRNIREVILYEYSPVIWGMNSATSTIGAKALDENKRQSLMETYYNISQAFENEYFSEDNWSGFLVRDIFDNSTMIVRAINLETEFDYYQLNWFEDENSYRFDDFSDWIGGNFSFVAGAKEADVDLENKAGRVLSQSNYDKLTQASELIATVIASATVEEMADDNDLESKTNETIEDKTDETDTLAKSQEALTNQRKQGLLEIEKLLNS